MWDTFTQDTFLQNLVWASIVLSLLFVGVRIFLHLIGHGYFRTSARPTPIKVSKSYAMSPSHKCVEMVWEGTRYLVMLHPQGITVVGEKPARPQPLVKPQEKAA